MPKDPWGIASVDDEDDPWGIASIDDEGPDIKMNPVRGRLLAERDKAGGRLGDLGADRIGEIGAEATGALSGPERALSAATDLAASLNPVPGALNIIKPGLGDSLVGNTAKALGTGAAAGLAGIADLGRGLGDVGAFMLNPKEYARSYGTEIPGSAFPDRVDGDERGAAVTRGGAGGWLDDAAGGIERTAERGTFSAGRARGEKGLAGIGRGKWYDVPGELLGDPEAAAALAGSAAGSLGSTMALGTVGRAAPLVGIGLQELHGIEEAQRAEEEKLGRNINPLERAARQVGTAGAIAGLERVVPDELMRASRGARRGVAGALLTPIKEGGTEAAQRVLADVGGTPEGAFDPTGTLIEGIGGVMGGAALGPLHLGKGGADLPGAPQRDIGREVVDHVANLSEYRKAAAKKAAIDEFSSTRGALEKAQATLREAVNVAAETNDPKDQAAAAEAKAQADVLEERLAGMEDPGLLDDKELGWVRRGKPKLGQARGGGNRVGRRIDDVDKDGNPIRLAAPAEDVEAEVLRLQQVDPALANVEVVVHEEADESFPMPDEERARYNEAIAAGASPQAASSLVAAPGSYDIPTGRIHVLAPALISWDHLRELVSGHELTHGAVSEAISKLNDPKATSIPLFGDAAGKERTFKALGKRAGDKTILGKTVARDYPGASPEVLAEEVLAVANEFAGTGKKASTSDRIVRRFRDSLRRVLPGPLQGFVAEASDAEIRVLLTEGRKLLASRGKPGGVSRAQRPAPPAAAPVEAPAPQQEPSPYDRLNFDLTPGAGPTIDEIALFIERITAEAEEASRKEAAAAPTAPVRGPATAGGRDVGVEQERAAARQQAQEAATRGRAVDDRRGDEARQAELDARAKLAREREAAQQAEVVGAIPMPGPAVLSNILERGAVSERPQPREPLPEQPIPVDQLIARTEEKAQKKATGKAPAATAPQGVPPVAGTPPPTAPAGPATKKTRKVRHSVRTRLGDETRERGYEEYSLANEQERARVNPKHWVRYAVPDTPTFSSDAATVAAKATLRQLGIDADNPAPINGLGPNGVWSKQARWGEVIVTTWPDGRPAYAYSVGPTNGVSWALRFPGGGAPATTPGETTKAERTARLLEQTDPEHPFRVAQGELASRNVVRDPTTDPLSPGGLATAELLAPADSFVKKFRRWSVDPTPIRGRVRYEHGNHDVLSDEQIQKGLEDLRTGRFGTAEAHAINMRALDEERAELAAGYNKGGKIRTAEEVFGRDDRRVVGAPGAAEQTPEGLGRGGVSRADEGLGAGTPQRGEAGRARGGELQAARGDARVEEEPFPEASEPLPPFKARYSMAGASARTADRDALKRAQKMVRAGASDDESWRETGWRRFPDGRWRFEISDHDASLNDDAYKRIPLDFKIGVPQVTLGELVNHPDLFEAYPGLRDIRVVRASQDDGGTVAALDKKANKILLYSRIDREPEGQVSFLLHEIQHAIQDTEGFAKGGSPETVARSVPEAEARQYAEQEAESLERSAEELEVEADELDARARLYAPIAQEMKAIRDTMFSEFSRREERIASAMDKARERLGDELSLDQMEKLTADVRNGRHPGALMDRANEIRRRAIAMREDAGDARRATGPALQRYVDRHADTFEFYKRLAGEAEARQTQARQRLTPEERRARDPYQDFDVPPEKQLVDRRRYSVRGEPVTGEDGVRRLTIFHMSNRDGLEEIDPKFQGTGQAGAEMKRRYDDGFEPFSNWYTGEPGTVVEAHRFGGKPMYESEVELTNEPGGVIEADRVEGRTAAQLKAEGYTGVYFPGAGQVQMLVPVKPSSVGTSPRPGRPTARGDEFYREATGREARYSRRQEETPEFKKWFGESKVVDEAGRPAVMYHGTAYEITEFKHLGSTHKNDSGWLGRGFYGISSPELASGYATRKKQQNFESMVYGRPNVMPLYFSIKRPYYATLADKRNLAEIDTQFGREEGGRAAERFTATLREKGYDGVILRIPADESSNKTGAEVVEVVAFSPTQIKSATGNDGAFDPENPDIRYSRRQEETPEFKAWFGRSKVVDEAGRPMVVYHGTNDGTNLLLSMDNRREASWYDAATKEFSVFDTQRGEMGSHFSPDPSVAASFVAKRPVGGRVYPVYLSVKNPLRLRDTGSWTPTNIIHTLIKRGELTYDQAKDANAYTQDGLRKLLLEMGYDGIVYLNRFEAPWQDKSHEARGVPESVRQDGSWKTKVSDEDFRRYYPEAQDSYIAFSPTQIKSATGNDGAFDPENPDIRYSRRDPAESQISWEALPGKSTGWLRGIHAAPYALRAAFTADIDTKVLRDALGRDRIARLFGVEETESVVAPGYWKGERNPSRQAFVRVPDGPDGLERVKAYAAARGYVLRQEAVGLHLARNTQAGERPNGYHTDIGRMPTAAEYADFVSGLNKIATPAERKKGVFVPVPTHAGINMWTWDGSISDERLRAVNDAALANIRSGATGEAHPLVVDSDLIENDWTEAPNGEIYVQRFTPSAGSPGVQGSLDQLRAAADKVGRQWASRHGWGTKLGAAEPAVPRDLESLVGRDVNPGLKGARRAKLFKDIARMVDGRALADMKFAAESGRAMKGWYRDSWQAIEKLFGEDAERFTSLLAALSPQQGVKENLKMAVDAWQTWVEAGRPSDPESVKSLFPVVARKWSESKKQWSNQYATIDIEARFNNTITALTDAPGTELSGSKVESFRRNLRGDLDAVTNDTWMAYFSEWQQKVFGTETGYLAGSYLVRRAAKKLGWTPAEVQETVWTFFRELADRTGVGGAKATDIAATMTMGDVISGSDSFAHLVRDTDVQKRFAALGLDVNSLPDLPRLSEEEASALAVRPEDRDSGVSRRVVGRAQRQADASWAQGEIKAAGVDGLNDSDPAALKKLAVALGIPTEGRTRNQTIAALRAYADPARYSRRPSSLDLTRGTGPADIPLNVPQVESVVDRLVESEGFVQGKGASYTPKPLDSDKPRPHGVVEHEAKVADFRVTDEQLQRKVASGKPLTDKEVMLANIRMETRREEMNDATTRRLEAEAMSAADRTSKGVDLGRLRIEEIDATLAHINMVLVRKNAGTALARGLAAMARKMEPGTKLTPDILTMKLTGIPGIHPKSIADLYRKYQDGDIEGFRDGVRKAIEPTWQHKWAEYYRGSLLTGIPTHMANFTGNIAEPALRAAETVAAAGVDKIVSTLRGTPRERFLGEARHELRGQMKAIAPAFRKLAADLYQQVLLQKEPTLDLGRKFDHQVGAIGGRTGTLVRTPFRALGVADDFFKSLGFAAEVEKRAYREARKEGLEGRDAERRAQEIIREAAVDPVGRWRGLMDAAHRGTLERVFQEDPAKIVRLAMQIANDHPLAAAIVVPFLKTPGNITRTGWRRSPMGLVLPGDFQAKVKTFRAQQAELRAGRTPEGEIVSRGDVEDALARGAVGTALATTFGLLAAAGMMTGSGPTDDKEKNAKRATGWQPYSFVIPGAGGDGKPLYVPFSRFEPTASLLGNIADAFELGDERSVLDKVTTSISTNWTNKTYFKGLNDAAAAITTPNRAAKRLAGSIVAAHVPNIVAKAADAADPVLRETRSESGLAGLGETVKRGVARRIPGVSRAAEPMYTATGEEAAKPGTSLTRFLSPIQATSLRSGTELEAYMAKIHEVPGDVPDAVAIPKELLPSNADVDWTGTRIFLTNEERAFLAKARRDAASQLRAELKQIQLLPVDEQRARIRRTFTKAQTAATKELWLTFPALRERARKKLER